MRRPLATLLVAGLLTTAAAACDDPPARNPAQIDIDAETTALEERVDEVRNEADERVESPDAASESSD